MKWRNSFSKPFLAVPSIHTPAPAIFFGFCLAWYSMTRGSTCLSVPTKLDARECHGDTKTETPKNVSIKKDQKSINQKHQNTCRTLTHFYWINGLWPNKKGPYEVPKRRIHHFPSSSPIHPIWVCLIGASKSNGSWSVYIMFPFKKGPHKRDYTIPYYTPFSEPEIWQEKSNLSHVDWDSLRGASDSVLGYRLMWRCQETRRLFGCSLSTT